ncbi:DUF4325 domain-containing protein [Xanthomonas oryzae pv. oryzae]|uniref:STAS-like domain-containing protein n=1 Tax=Xanthomonas oryzae TaxID=347 RepID=UPI00094A012E|nr:DUF4325 domain-containing protein [Xanthomonas oryzae]QGH65411.1 DUF4325 domain-containing protein [Xanthomonas oryzae pv. oryzicola]RBA50147.1 DUF4325 domain-containing protein [Xanthomonas oryzae pv. oryzae]RBD49850.1 DUF4325 domain-containing protein [Xanthomonas oryzae pv. oryzae]RBE34571.1 DUF4325 domain-containing protein [Xanthomonas oryzae pv. oryzae]RBE42544.1 DUF4325 domain-containing protein [Xanthomonas oryzae pv. oryzae]
MTVIREANIIRFQGQYRDSDIHAPLACFHHAVNDLGYQDIILDFSFCTETYPGPMLSLCAEVLRLRKEMIDTQLILPNKPDLARLFINANWAHILEPRAHNPSRFRGHTQIPATQFTNPDEQYEAVNRIVNAILGGIPDIRREHFAALEWAVNELTDNVIVHSKSAIGGLVQVSSFKRNSKIVEFTIADSGLGIPATLRSGKEFSGSDTDALDRAIREGVTRDKSIGQGNGLFGSYQICCHSGGAFRIESGHARLLSRPSPYGLEIRDQKIPVKGTLIIAKINFSDPDLLKDALNFSGKSHKPVDYIETKYEGDSDNIVHVVLLQETQSFGSRFAGTPIHLKIYNLVQMCSGQPIEIDFSGVPLVSSSFADEVFGKLFVKLGPLEFMQRIRFKNVENTVRMLIDKAISQRVSTGLGS